MCMCVYVHVRVSVGVLFSALSFFLSPKQVLHVSGSNRGQRIINLELCLRVENLSSVSLTTRTDRGFYINSESMEYDFSKLFFYFYMGPATLFFFLTFKVTLIIRRSFQWSGQDLLIIFISKGFNLIVFQCRCLNQKCTGVTAMLHFKS